MEKLEQTKFGKVSINKHLFTTYEMDCMKPIWEPKGFYEYYKAKYIAESSMRMAMRIQRSKILIKKFIEEIVTVQTDHPNAMRVYEWFTDRYYLYIITEIPHGGTLLDKIAKMKGFTEVSAAYVTKQILSLMSFYEKEFGYQVSLSPNKIFFENTGEDLTIKIENPHLERAIYNSLACSKAEFDGEDTYHYQAPEVLIGKPHKLSSMWTLGIIVFQMITGQLPFQNKNPSNLKKMILNNEFTFHLPLWRKKTDCKAFIMNLLITVTERTNAEKALADDWLKKVKEFTAKEADEMALEVVNGLKRYNRNEKIKHALLSYLAMQVSEKEVDFARKAFMSLDKNRDGKLSRAEISEGLLAAKAGKELKSIIDTIDEDGDGFIDYNEFLSAILGDKVASNKARLLKAFQELDKDHDGYISEKELKRILSPHFGEDEEVEMHEIMKKIDSNGDGKISAKELIAFLS